MTWLRSLFAPRVWSLFLRALWACREAEVPVKQIEVRMGKGRIWVDFAVAGEEEEEEEIGFVSAGAPAMVEVDDEEEE